MNKKKLKNTSDGSFSMGTLFTVVPDCYILSNFFRNSKMTKNVVCRSGTTVFPVDHVDVPEVKVDAVLLQVAADEVVAAAPNADLSLKHICRSKEKCSQYSNWMHLFPFWIHFHLIPTATSRVDLGLKMTSGLMPLQTPL